MQEQIQKQSPCFMPGVGEYLETILNKDMMIFEWGSGFSTPWFADRVKFIYSVEHQLKWFNAIRLLLEENQNNNYQLIFQPICPIKNYIDVIKDVADSSKIEFNLIVIDGRHRVECLMEALIYLKLKGFIIFDDIQRIRYKSVKEILPKFNAKYFEGSIHKNCMFDDDPSGYTRQVTGIFQI